MFIVDQNNSVVTSTDLLKIIDGTRHTVQFIEIVSATRNFLAIKTNKGKQGKTRQNNENGRVCHAFHFRNPRDSQHIA